MSVLTIRGITKSFFSYPVLTGIDLELAAGKVHGLVGENGAGKSTLMKILAGVHVPDAGSIHIDGRPVAFTHPTHAHAAGISTVFQEFNLLPERTVAENIYLGREPRRHGLVSVIEMNRLASGLFSSIGIVNIDPARRVGELTVAEQQIVEIAKALSHDALVISMDEPTAALAEHEVELLYAVIRRLTERGVAILYVSHRLREVFDLCDSITVLKDGALVCTKPAEELNENELVRLMVGRPLSAFFAEPETDQTHTSGPVVLELDGVGNTMVDGISLQVGAGEIVGVSGLQGAGRTELFEGISGAVPFTRGTIRLDGREISISRPRDAIRHGIAHITEDRKATGLALGQSVLDNTLSVIRATRPRDVRAARRRALSMLQNLELAARGPDQEARYLSGGNQQKVVLAKWLLMEPRVLLLDEPTRGIDVGAKQALYALLRTLAAAGHAVLMISSELPELIGMSDRILVLRDGQLVAELPAGSPEEIILAAASGVEGVAA